MIKYKHCSISLMLLFLTTTLFARQDVEMADSMRSEGKIYVVVGIILIIVVGLVAYLFMLDRRIRKMEEGAK
jgi:Zn-dependent protease with chaperone function